MRFLALCTLLYATTVVAEKPIVLDPDYDHTRYMAGSCSLEKKFAAFTVCMDDLDDDNGDGEPDAMGTPEWVAHEIKAFDGACIPTKKRPKWSSEARFVEAGIAPKDNSYVYSRVWRKHHPDWYVRGHLAMKLIAERISHDAAANTHTFLNAVPQRSRFNGGIWLDLEYITTAWAQRYGSVWVMTGPVYIDEQPSGYIGQDDEFKVAIPDALFKVVVKEVDGGVESLAFLYPQVGPGYFSKSYQHDRFLTSVEEIELLTGLKFAVDDKIVAAAQIWPYEDNEIIDACRKS